MGIESGHASVVAEHYERMADTYDGYLSYSGDFVRSLTGTIIDKLRLGPDDRFVDLGGGTGLYTAAVLEQLPLRHEPVLVDPIEAMLEQVPADLPVRKVAMDSLEWAAEAADSEQPYDKVLIKESIHHVEARDQLLSDLFRCLSDDGAIMLVHVPPAVEYPLFSAALDRALEWHADPFELERLVKQAGFDVEREPFEHRHRIPRPHYLQMVRDQYMSVLSTFSPEEIEVGVAEIDERYADQDVLEFTDRFDCIVGRKG